MVATYSYLQGKCPPHKRFYCNPARADLATSCLKGDTSLKSIEIEIALPVRTYDIDSAGHVSNIVYIRWLEDLRLELFEKHFSLKELMQNNCTLVLRSTFIEYLRPIKLFDSVRAKMWVENLAKASIDIKAEFFIDELLTTKASHLGVFVNLSTLKARRVPSAIVTKFAEQDLS
jgi:acyl-CoA thioester hydrolase